jgi:hypothetical protein
MDIYVAGVKSTVTRHAADDNYLGTVFVADQAATLSHYRADSQYTSTVATTNITLQARQYAADSNYARITQVSEIEAAARRSDADFAYASNQVREDAETSVTARKLDWGQSGWDMVYPQFLATESGPPLPTWWKPLPLVIRRTSNPRSAVDRRINQRWAKLDVQGVAEAQEMAGDLGGRGWTPAGPGLEMRVVGVVAKSIRAKADAYSGGWIEVAGQNAQSLIDAQVLAAEAIVSWNRSAVAAEKAWNTRQVGYLEQAAALAST